MWAHSDQIVFIHVSTQHQPSIHQRPFISTPWTEILCPCRNPTLGPCMFFDSTVITNYKPRTETNLYVQKMLFESICDTSSFACDDCERSWSISKNTHGSHSRQWRVERVYMYQEDADALLSRHPKHEFNMDTESPRCNVVVWAKKTKTEQIEGKNPENPETRSVRNQREKTITEKSCLPGIHHLIKSFVARRTRGIASLQFIVRRVPSTFIDSKMPLAFKWSPKSMQVSPVLRGFVRSSASYEYLTKRQNENHVNNAQGPAILDVTILNYLFHFVCLWLQLNTFVITIQNRNDLGPSCHAFQQRENRVRTLRILQFYNCLQTSSWILMANVRLNCNRTVKCTI